MASAGNLALHAHSAGSGFQLAFDCFVRVRRLRLDQRAQDGFELDGWDKDDSRSILPDAWK